MNTYGYVGGNPLYWTDFTGLASWFRGFDFGISTLGPITTGAGATEVHCKDECGEERTFEFIKICAGYAPGGQIIGGLISKLSEEQCRPQNYSGYFLEFSGGYAGASGGIDIGLTDNNGNLLPDGASGVNEGGIGIGTPGIGVQICYYVFVNER